MPFEDPWMPDAQYLTGLPEQYILLLSPAGRYHLLLDKTGQWWHLRPDTPDPIDAGRAAQLRPSDVDIIIKMTMIWAWKSVVGDDHPVDDRVPTVVDELARAVKQMIVSYASQAQQARMGGGQ